MNVLHVLSNYKWTERSEPATDLVLAQRALGAKADLVCGRNRADPLDSIEYRAGRKGVTPLMFELPKHFEFTTALRDIRSLRTLYREHPADVVHCHLENGWFLSTLAVRGLRPKPLVVGHAYDPEGMKQSLRTRFLTGAGTDGIIVIGEEAKQSLLPRFDPTGERIAVIEPGVDVGRFSAPRRNTREQFGLRDEFVIGMVTAFGRRRRVDLVLGAVALLAKEIPELRLLLIGRGKLDLIVEEPAKAMGIRDRIVRGGYCRDQALVDAYHAMDALAYPWPGTDKSCRTVREALTAGVPVVASRVGFLPNLVADGQTGCVVEPTPEGMAEGIRRLYRMRAELPAMSRRASETSARRFSLSLQAEKTMAFYNKLRKLRAPAKA